MNEEQTRPVAEGELSIAGVNHVDYTNSKEPLPADAIIIRLEGEDALQFEVAAWKGINLSDTIRQFPVDGDFKTYALHSFCLDFYEHNVFCEARFVPKK